MDSLHAIGFYVSSGVLLAGAVAVAVMPSRELRALGLGAVALGLAGAYLALSAGLVAVVALVCYAGCAAMVAVGPGYRTIDAIVSSLWRQLGAVAAAALLAGLAFSAWRGDFVHANFTGGAFDARAVARLLFEHDVLATESIVALALAAVAGATAVWRLRDRVR
jgi:NADH:ubiquinone oxidoreductase subunit 6 (subunit J)